MNIREYTDKDIPGMIEIWNEVVEEGISFPQEDFLDEKSGKEFFGEQSGPIEILLSSTSKGELIRKIGLANRTVGYISVDKPKNNYGVVVCV